MVVWVVVLVALCQAAVPSAHTAVQRDPPDLSTSAGWTSFLEELSLPTVKGARTIPLSALTHRHHQHGDDDNSLPGENLSGDRLLNAFHLRPVAEQRDGTLGLGDKVPNVNPNAEKDAEEEDDDGEQLGEVTSFPVPGAHHSSHSSHHTRRRHEDDRDDDADEQQDDEQNDSADDDEEEDDSRPRFRSRSHQRRRAASHRQYQQRRASDSDSAADHLPPLGADSKAARTLPLSSNVPQQHPRFSQQQMQMQNDLPLPVSTSYQGPGSAVAADASSVAARTAPLPIHQSQQPSSVMAPDATLPLPHATVYGNRIAIVPDFRFAEDQLGFMPVALKQPPPPVVPKPYVAPPAPRPPFPTDADVSDEGIIAARNMRQQADEAIKALSFFAKLDV